MATVCEDRACPNFERFPHSHPDPLRVSVKIERPLTERDVLDIADTALTGIAYWANVRQLVPLGEPDRQIEDGTALFQVNERGGESERRDDWLDVTPEVIARGISLVLSGVTNEAAGRTEFGTYWAGKPPTAWQFEPRLLADMTEFGAMDADEADWVVQLGLFGHLVFG